MTYTKITVHVHSNKQKSGKSEHRQMTQFVEKNWIASWWQSEPSNRNDEIVLVSRNKFRAQYETISIRAQTMFASVGVTPWHGPAEHINETPRMSVDQGVGLWSVPCMLKLKHFHFVRSQLLNCPASCHQRFCWFIRQIYNLCYSKCWQQVISKVTNIVGITEPTTRLEAHSYCLCFIFWGKVSLLQSEKLESINVRQ